MLLNRKLIIQDWKIIKLIENTRTVLETPSIEEVVTSLEPLNLNFFEEPIIVRTWTVPAVKVSVYELEIR